MANMPLQYVQSYQLLNDNGAVRKSVLSFGRGDMDGERFTCHPYSSKPIDYVVDAIRTFMLAGTSATPFRVCCCADSILSAGTRRRFRTSFSFDSVQMSHLVGSNCHGFTPLR